MRRWRALALALVLASSTTPAQAMDTAGCTVEVVVGASATCESPLIFTSVPTSMFAHATLHHPIGRGTMHIDWIRYTDIGGRVPIQLAQWDCEVLPEIAGQFVSTCKLHDTMPYVLLGGEHAVRVTARAGMCPTSDLARCTMHGAIEFS